MLKLAIALTGLLFGVLLANIAPEELVPGRKYFILLQRLLAGIIVVIAVYALIQASEFLLLGVFSILVVTMVFLDITTLDNPLSKLWTRLGFYGILAIPYVASSNQAFQLLLARLLFVYGLPVGTLLVRGPAARGTGARGTVANG